MSFSIIGTGKSVPEHIVTNDMLSEFLDTSDEWIVERTGIKVRHVMTSETLLDLAAKASEDALKDAGITAKDVDMIICSTLQGDYVSPALSCLVAESIGCDTGFVFDMNMGCSGFIFALETADSFLECGRARRILIVCAEALSRHIDWNDRSTCVLFGDGAGAVVVEKSDSKVDFITKVNGSYEELYIPGEEGNNPYKSKCCDVRYLKMNGREIFKFAVSSIVSDAKELLDKNGMTTDDISFYILHQANLRIINSARQRLKQDEEKFPHNVETHGNTSSASIPMLLDDLNKSGKLKNGMTLMLSAFGAGLSRGACIIKWSK